MTKSPSIFSDPIHLDNPIQRGEAAPITSVQIRKPGAGELRGLQLNMLIAGDVSAHLTLLPRITMPPIHEHEMISPESMGDFTDMVNEAVSFLLSRSIRASLPNLSMTSDGT